MNEMLTFGQMLAVHARVLGDGTGARDLDRAMSFRQWNERSCPLGNVLLRLGLTKGEGAEDLSGAIERALANAPTPVDAVTSQTVVSSDARKGLGFVPDYQALTAWDDAQRKRRES